MFATVIEALVALCLLLGAVFGARAGLTPNMIAIMLSITIFVGALMQFPAGKASDRTDRRYVLAALSALAALAALALIVLQPADALTMIVLVAIYGAAANALYPIAVAHANDFASADEFVQVSGGLLLLYGIGTIIGPTIGGPVMTELGPHALFAVTAAAHVLLTAYAIYRSRLRAAIPVAERETVPNMPVSASPMSTPESLTLDPRAAPLGTAAGDVDAEAAAKGDARP